MALIDNWIGYTLAGVVILVGLGAIYQAIATARDKRKYPPPGQLVDVGGFRLHIYCTGEGSPTVVLEAGSSGSSLDWCTVQSEIAKFTHVCSYDRSSLGWSDASPFPRSIAQTARELFKLLVHSDIKGPYVLVGHSLGGLYLQFFARRYPNRVAGMVLLDSPHPEVFTHQSSEYSKQTRIELRKRWLAAHFGLMRLGLLTGPHLEGLPSLEQQISTTFSLHASHWRTEIEQSRLLDETVPDIMDDAGLFPEIPLTVITLPTFDWLEPMGPEIPAFWAESQKRLAGLSKRGKLIVAAENGHMIPLDQPDLVIEAVREVVEVIRVDTVRM